MARRRVRASAQRAWTYGATNVEFTVDFAANMSTEGIMIAFEDIESDEPLVSRETSEFYFERLLIWARPYGFSTNLGAFPYQASLHRLGVLNDSIDMGLGEAPDAAANNFDRILQEQVHWGSFEQALTFDGAALAVSTEATGDSRGIPVRPIEWFWDLSSKFSLREDTSLVWQISSGPEFPANTGAVFGCDLIWKALLRKRTQ